MRHIPRLASGSGVDSLMPKKGWECSRSLTGALLSLSLAASFHRTFRSTVSLQTAALSASGWSYPACQKLGEVGEQTRRLQDCCWCYLWKPGCKAKAALCCCCGARTSLREAQCLKRRGQLLCGFLQAHTSGFLSGDCPSLLASTSLILFLSPPPPPIRSISKHHRVNCKQCCSRKPRP